MLIHVLFQIKADMTNYSLVRFFTQVQYVPSALPAIREVLTKTRVTTF